jgi:hypothetical protein
LHAFALNDIGNWYCQEELEASEGHQVWSAGQYWHQQDQEASYAQYQQTRAQARMTKLSVTGKFWEDEDFASMRSRNLLLRKLFSR